MSCRLPFIASKTFYCRYEERKLFPFIEKRYQIPSISVLVDDHRDLDIRVQLLSEALLICENSESVESEEGTWNDEEDIISDALVAAIEFDDCLVRHLGNGYYSPLLTVLLGINNEYIYSTRRRCDYFRSSGAITSRV